MNLNATITAIGLEILGDFHRDFSKNGLPLISVGSGSGYIEKLLANVYQTPLICVDPVAPTICAQKPEYAYVSHLCMGRPAYIGACNVFINWPFPTALNSGYDMEAIETLQPDNILLIISTCGLSGSARLLSFVKSIPTANGLFDDNDFILFEYNTGNKGELIKERVVFEQCAEAKNNKNN